MGLIERKERPFVCEGGDAGERRREPDIFEQLERIRRGEPVRPSDDIFSQVERAMRERRVSEVSAAGVGGGHLNGARIGVLAGLAAGQHDPSPGFTDDRGVFVSTEHPDYEGQLMRWLLQLRIDGIITEPQLQELDSASYRTRLPTRAELARQRLDEMLKERVLTRRLHGDLVRECVNPGFRIHPNPLYYEKILRCRYMLEEIRDFMDQWIKQGMPVEPGSLLEGRLRTQGSIRRMRGVAAEGMDNLLEGKKEVRLAWAVFRPAVEDVIVQARNVPLVSFGTLKHPYTGEPYRGRNIPYMPGWTLDERHVGEGTPMEVMDTLIHEPLHDADRLFLGHSVLKDWKKVDKTIGWDIEGDWAAGITQLLSWIEIIMKGSPSTEGPGHSRWEQALGRSGIPECP